MWSFECYDLRPVSAHAHDGNSLRAHSPYHLLSCTPGDVSRWGMQALEQGGWSWSNVLRAYKAIESFVPESETEAEAVSGQDEAEGASKHSSFHGDGSRGPSLRTTR